MSRKDYIALARVFAEAPHTDLSRSLAEGVASVLARDNPRFDRQRFMSACGF